MERIDTNADYLLMGSDVMRRLNGRWLPTPDNIEWLRLQPIDKYIFSRSLNRAPLPMDLLRLRDRLKPAKVETVTVVVNGQVLPCLFSATLGTMRIGNELGTTAELIIFTKAEDLVG